MGGTIGNTTVNYHGMPAWTNGAAHLVFLRLEDTPTKEGFEPAWVVVADSQGVFLEAGGAWQNSATQTELKAAEAAKP